MANDLDDCVGIVFFNDDVTPMEAVVDLLQQEFGLSEDDAIDRMLAIHHHGFSVAKVCERAEAEALLARIAILPDTRLEKLSIRVMDDPDALVRDFVEESSGLPLPSRRSTILILVAIALGVLAIREWPFDGMGDAGDCGRAEAAALQDCFRR